MPVGGAEPAQLCRAVVLHLVVQSHLEGGRIKDARPSTAPLRCSYGMWVGLGTCRFRSTRSDAVQSQGSLGRMMSKDQALWFTLGWRPMDLWHEGPAALGFPIRPCISSQHGQAKRDIPRADILQPALLNGGRCDPRGHLAISGVLFGSHACEWVGWKPRRPPMSAARVRKGSSPKCCCSSG